MIRQCVSAAAILGLGLGFSLPARSSTFHPLDAIDRQIAAFTGADIGQPGGASLPVDRKLRLRPCAAMLDVSWHGPARQAVLVQCGDAGGWRVFVPVTAAPAAVQQRAVVKRRDSVRVESGGAGFTIARQGQALEDGAAGDWIRVQLTDTAAQARNQARNQGRIITGQILPDGRVVVPIR